MSTFENPAYRWRETYFVLMGANDRPTVSQVESALAALNDRFELQNLQADDEGRFESVTLVSPDDFAALDICYSQGDEVAEQVAQLVKEMKQSGVNKSELKKIAAATARLDVLHFQDVAAGIDSAVSAADFDEDNLEEMFDPSALLVVLEALVELTGGIAVDPQTGTTV
ncbi:MAG: hypothetical protein DCC68_25565 [Planctomycetota bacterium]|nr:MAG: hypothetical protein DCC68_25565 [Planctomycetota bacterium]